MATWQRNARFRSPAGMFSRPAVQRAAPALAGGAMLIAAGFALLRTSLAPPSAGVSTAATVMDGRTAVTLSVPGAAVGSNTLHLRLSPVKAQPVWLGLGSPGSYDPPAAPMQRRGNVYRLRREVGVSGLWTAVVHVGSKTALPDRFLLRVPDRAGEASTPIIPLLSGGAVQRAAVPLGRWIAHIAVSPMVGGPAAVRVRLIGTGKPASVSLALNMEAMNMGWSRFTARPSAGGWYTAHVPFSMAGLWRLVLAAGDAAAQVDVALFPR